MASPPPELPLVGLSSPSEDSSASRSARLGSRRSPHVLALAGLDSGVFLDAGPPHGRKLMRDPLLKFDSPSECYRGAPPDSALAVFPQALAVRTGTRLSWGSAPLRRLRCGCHRAATTGANADRVRRRLPDLHRCRPRAFSAPRRFEPRRLAHPGCPEPLETTFIPVAVRPCFVPLTSLGFALQSFPLPESRTASSAAVASLRVRPRTCRGAETHARREAFRCALDQEPRRGHEAHDRDRLEGTHLPALTETAGPSRELPRTPHPSAAHVTGLADHTAGSPASKLCSLRESVHAAFARRAGACAPSRRTTPGRCSPGVTPFWSLLHQILGSGRSRECPANRTPPEDHAPLR
jgi:hypothetical protein